MSWHVKRFGPTIVKYYNLSLGIFEVRTYKIFDKI